MRKILALILTLGLATGGCAWFGGSSSTEEAKPAQPQEQAAAPTPAPAPEAPAKDVKSKGKNKAAKHAAKKTDSRKIVKTEAQITAELGMVGHKLVAQASRTVMPSKASKAVRQEGKDFVASYVEVDPGEVTTELHPSTAGQYVGYVRYQEKVMECRGKNRKEATTTAVCQQVKARNINELIRYDGSNWQY